jgi:hypothetical protein
MVYSVGMLSSWVRRFPGVQVLVCSVVALLSFCGVQASGTPVSSPQSPQKADSILILKKDHVMELVAGGKVSAHTKWHSVEADSLRSSEKEMLSRPKAGMSLMRSTTIANTTKRFTSPIQMPLIAKGPTGCMFLPEKQS